MKIQKSITSDNNGSINGQMPNAHFVLIQVDATAEVTVETQPAAVMGVGTRQVTRITEAVPGTAPGAASTSTTISAASKT